MSRLYVGQLVRTNYNTGPYRITKITGPCDDPSFVDSLNLRDKAPKSKPHYCITCRTLNPRDHSDYYLNGYDDSTLRNVWRDDCLIDLTDETTLLTLGLLL